MRSFFRRIYKFLTSRRTLFALGIFLAVVVIFMAWCDHRISSVASRNIYASIEKLPHNRVGLVLGTAERVRGGRPNLYFTYRIEAATALYKAGKVDHLLLSGDNRTMYYNEPWVMRRALINAGVDSSAITLDYAGFRTLDSVVRAKEVFGQSTFTVISQRFHNERAVYLARRLGIGAVGFDARDVQKARGFKTQAREKLARVKVFYDLLFEVEPHFLGEPVIIGEQTPA